MDGCSATNLSVAMVKAFDRRSLVALALAVASTPARARVPSDRQLEDDCERFGPLNTTQLCNAVGDTLGSLSPLPTAPVQIHYQYQELLYSAAGVNPWRDTRTHAAKKLKHWWTIHQSGLVCTQLGFSIRSGHLLKLAVERDSRPFLDDVIRRWELSLEGTDQTGETVRGFTEAAIARGVGTASESILQRYLGLLAKAGAPRRIGEPSTWRDPYEAEVRPLLGVWEKASYASENLRAVKKNDLWGYVDQSGRVAIPPRYSGAFCFSEGRAAVHRDGRWGYVDPTGTEVIPLRFADVRVFHQSKASVSLDGRDWRFIDTMGAAR